MSHPTAANIQQFRDHAMVLFRIVADDSSLEDLQEILANQCQDTPLEVIEMYQASVRRLEQREQVIDHYEDKYGVNSIR